MDGSDRFKIIDGEVAAKVIDGEAIVINLGTGMYYSMGDVGGSIWSVIERNGSLNEIVQSVAAEYDVEPDELRADVQRLLAELLAERLIVMDKSFTQGTAPGPTTNGGTKPYASPTIRKFGDMAEMFALDPPLPGLAQPGDGPNP